MLAAINPSYAHEQTLRALKSKSILSFQKAQPASAEEIAEDRALLERSNEFPGVIFEKKSLGDSLSTERLRALAQTIKKAGAHFREVEPPEARAERLRVTAANRPRSNTRGRGQRLVQQSLQTDGISQQTATSKLPGKGPSQAWFKRQLRRQQARMERRHEVRMKRILSQTQKQQRLVPGQARGSSILAMRLAQLTAKLTQLKLKNARKTVSSVPTRKPTKPVRVLPRRLAVKEADSSSDDSDDNVLLCKLAKPITTRSDDSDDADSDDNVLLCNLAATTSSTTSRQKKKQPAAVNSIHKPVLTKEGARKKRKAMLAVSQHFAVRSYKLAKISRIVLQPTLSRADDSDFSFCSDTDN
jgi:hypothetical protein